METTENNKLIAEFMGIEDDNANLEYQTSWDWLMPVVREALMLIDINKLDFDTDALKCEVLDLDLKHAYIEVIRFINWYNKQN